MIVSICLPSLCVTFCNYGTAHFKKFMTCFTLPFSESNFVGLIFISQPIILSISVLALLVGQCASKNRPEMTYYVSGGTLHATRSLTH